MKARCQTEELRDSMEVVQNLVLPMKFEFKSSKRAIPYVVVAIEEPWGDALRHEVLLREV